VRLGVIKKKLKEKRKKRSDFINYFSLDLNLKGICIEK
jgi:hypothetical protein